jgi:hypothetical protein
MGLTWNDLNNSKYMNAADVAGKRIPVTIERIVIETVGTSNEKKAVAYFVGMTKGVVLNKARRTFLAGLSKSPNVDAAVGLDLVLCAGITQFQGDDTPCIRFARTAAADKAEVEAVLGESENPADFV